MPCGRSFMPIRRCCKPWAIEAPSASPNAPTPPPKPPNSPNSSAPPLPPRLSIYLPQPPLLSPVPLPRHHDPRLLILHFSLFVFSFFIAFPHHCRTPPLVYTEP